MDHSNDRPHIDITVTADYLSEEDYEAVKAQLEPHLRVTGGIVYELSEVEVAHVVVQFLITGAQGVGFGVFANYLYEAFKKRLLKPKGANGTFFEFVLKEDDKGNRYTYGRLETDNDDVLREALTTLEVLARPESKNASFEFDERQRQWKRHKDE